MEANEQTLQALAKYLQQTMSPNKAHITEAEQALKSVEDKPGFTVVLSKLISMENVDLPTRLAGAIYFKNFIMREWEPDTDVNLIPDSDRNTIKTHLVNLMLTCPKSVQAQLSQAMGIISKADFPAKWQNLLPELVSKLGSDSTLVVCGVLETAHSIFYRYNYEPKSDPLWEEILYVLGIFQEPLLAIFMRMCGYIDTFKENKQALTDVFKVLNLVVQIFYSLNSQDIPEFFEDHKTEWFGNFQMLLKYTNPLLDPSDPDEPGPVEIVKKSICECIELYTNKYEEEFKDFVPVFVDQTWKLLTTLSDQGRYDPLVTHAIKFLTSVVKKAWHKELFSSEAALRTICEKVVLPQLKLRESDVELFHENGLDYIRRDIEGSDIDTRRRTTVDFVRGLCTHFEEQVTAILKDYVMSLLQEYTADPKNKWVNKDAAMYIILALTVKGAVQSKGATSINPYVDIVSFLQTHVLPELQAPDITALPVLKSDCLKFCSTFRNQLPTEAYPVLMPLFMKFLASEEFVVHTYAAASIERLMSVREGGKPKFDQQALKPILPNLLAALFQTLEHDDSKENSYVMKCIMRVCGTAGESIGEFAATIIGQITKILAHVSSNPKSPQFNHFLFETLACLVGHLCKNNPENIGRFEAALFPPFEAMLKLETCAEFGPYVFQILSQLLEFRPDVSQAYQAIFPSTLAPFLWDNHGNVPALVRLLRAYLQTGAQAVVTPERITGLLGIFQKLNASKKLDHYGFLLLQNIVEFIPLDIWGNYLTEIFKLIFARLQPASRTNKFVQSLCSFLAVFINKHGVDPMIEAMNQVQNGILSMILERVWIPGCNLVTDEADRKLCIIGQTRLLCSPAMLQNYSNHIPQMLYATVKLFAEPDDSSGDDYADLVDQSDASFNTAFARLAFAPDPGFPCANADQYKTIFAQSIGQLIAQHQAQMVPMLQQMPPPLQKLFKDVMQAENVTLPF